MSLEGAFEFRVSYDSPDSDWDCFLEQIPGGHHVQSSLWALINRCLGWQAVRITARQDNETLAGVQVLFKPFSTNGAVGYVPKGPVFRRNDPVLIEALFNELSHVAELNHISFLSLQPPNNANAWVNQLEKFGFQPSAVKMGPTATVFLDLTIGLDTLLNQMKSRTRYNIRLGDRKGIRTIEGKGRDLETYCRLARATSERQKFSNIPNDLFLKMWEVLEPCGYIKLFLAEHKGDIISAQLVVTFGDTVINKLSVWSGERAELKPNEALQWYAIQWSKNHGYHYYDLEGIDPEIAHGILHNEAALPEQIQSFTSFKLGFGGQVVEVPGVYDVIYNKEMRLIYDTALEKIRALKGRRTNDMQF